MMPDMDGFEVLYRLRDNLETRYLPVIMLTCKGDSGSIFKAQDLDVADYLIKPFETEELIKTIRKCLAK